MAGYDSLDRETLIRLLQRRDAIRAQEDMVIVDELTSQRRRRVFAYKQCLGTLSEGAQPL